MLHGLHQCRNKQQNNKMIRKIYLLLTIGLCINLVLGSPVKFVFDVEEMDSDRVQKSLLNTFPFNQQENENQQTILNEQHSIPEPFR